MNRRAFLGLSGASVLAGLVKKWLPKEKAILGVDVASESNDFTSCLLCSGTHNNYRVLKEFQVAHRNGFTPEQWFERRRWSRMMAMATHDALQHWAGSHYVRITRFNPQPMEIHAEWYEVEDVD